MLIRKYFYRIIPIPESKSLCFTMLDKINSIHQNVPYNIML